jgi:hypothetical protein
MNDFAARRDFGLTWKSRLDESRARAAGTGPTLTPDEVTALQREIASLDVTSPPDSALLWSGRDILTGVPMDEELPLGPKWWDKLSCQEAALFSALGICCRLEDTPGGDFLVHKKLHYREEDPLFAIVQGIWADLSHRFAAAAVGRVEIICEGAFEESVLRSTELEALLVNPRVTALNGLERKFFPPHSAHAFRLLRRWDVERARRYSAFVAADLSSTARERFVAHDDFREVQLWYEQDFFDDLGPDRELPSLPTEVITSADQTSTEGGWKYSAAWRTFIRQTAKTDE